jgi:hypothetical protein
MLRRCIEPGRFCAGRGEIPDNAVVYLARQIEVEPTEITFCDFHRSRKRGAPHSQIREALGFREHGG